MSGFSFQRSLQILALDAIVRPDWEASYRRVCRWYSRNFHVPLPEVYELPIADVMRDYFEGMYEDLEKDELARIAAEICETDEQKAKREAEEQKKLLSEKNSVAASMAKLKEKLDKAKSGVVQAVDTLGKLRARPNAKTLTDLKASDDMDGLVANVSEMLKSAPPAPKPRVSADYFKQQAALEDFKYEVGGTIDEDMDAIGGNAGNLKPKKP